MWVNAVVEVAVAVDVCCKSSWLLPFFAALRFDLLDGSSRCRLLLAAFSGQLTELVRLSDFGHPTGLPSSALKVTDFLLGDCRAGVGRVRVGVGSGQQIR